MDDFPLNFVRNAPYAIIAGKIALTLLLLAPVNYLARTFLVYCIKNKKSEALIARLRSLVKFTRKTHSYIGMLLAAAAVVHVYFWGTPNGLSIKAWFGVATACAMVYLLMIGAIMEKNPSIVVLRKRHRFAGLIIVILALIHRLL